jgi:hypothetical protein
MADVEVSKRPVLHFAYTLSRRKDNSLSLPLSAVLHAHSRHAAVSENAGPIAAEVLDVCEVGGEACVRGWR